MPDLQPIPRQSLSNAVFEQLRDQILQGELLPGARMPSERVLCEALAVNRASVREALRRLEEARLVSVRHGGSSQVLDYRDSSNLALLPSLLWKRAGEFDAQVIASVMEMRSALGPDIARRAAERGGPGLAAELARVVEAMERAGGDAAELQELTARYWTLLVEGSGNIAYRLAYNCLRDTYDLCRPLLTQVLAEENAALERYEAITGAVDGGDPIAAESAARALMALGEHSIKQALKTIEGEAGGSE